MRLLRRHLPQSEIYWWIESGFAPLLEGDPDLTGLVLFHRRRWTTPLNWGELWGSVQWVRRQRFDWVIDLQCLARSAVFAWLANGRLTIGLDEPREFARGYYDIVVRRPSFHTHAADWYLEVLRRLEVPVHNDFEWLPARPEAAAAVAAKWAADKARWVVIQPGARWPTKRWPVAYFSAVIRSLAAEDPRLRFVVFGAADDCHLGEALATNSNGHCLDLTGQTSLLEMVEWIRRSELMITNDTGPMHVAAALRKPLVAIFGPTEPRRTGPYGQLNHVLQLDLPCSPCLKSRCRYERKYECLKALSPEPVIRAARERLA